MNELQLADRFDRKRPQLRAVGYRILGSPSEADDAVQAAWLPLQRADTEEIDSLERWLTTVLARICLNMLRARRTRSERPLYGLRPEPIIDDPAVGTDPEHEALLADSVGMALQVVLDTLSPAERLAFVLHDMFGFPSTKSGRCSGVHRHRPASSPVAPAGGCANGRQRRTRT